MSKTRIYHWIVTAGVMLVLLGFTNAVSVFIAGIQAAPLVAPDLLDQLEPVSSPREAAQKEAPSPVQSDSWFMVPAEADDAPLSGRRQTRQLLAGLYTDEDLYAQQLRGEVMALPTPRAPEIPIRLVIPAIELDAPILAVEPELVSIAGRDYQVWHAPDEYGVGWHANSATLGATGNTVLNGHHNVYGEVFKRLEDLQPGDELIVRSELGSHHYVLVNRMILKEKYAPIEQRLENAQWILPSEDERLTLITCWPYQSNTHRLVLVARPVEARQAAEAETDRGE